MAEPFPLFEGCYGMQRDVSRYDVSCWNLVDYIPGLNGPVRKRGGWAYGSNDIHATHAGSTYLAAVAYPEYTSGAKLVAIGNDGELFTVNTSTNAVTDVGAAVVPIAPLALHRNKLIITGPDGATAPKYYDGTTLAPLGGSPPNAKYGCVFKDFSVLANWAGNETTLAFSAAGNPASYDTTNSIVNMTYPVAGLAALSNAILTFSTNHCERLRGSIPPPGSDFVKEPAFDHGCIDARSICTYGSYVLFASTEGIFLTDGATPVDLTKAAGMSSYWRALFNAYTSSWTVSGGVYSGYYVLSIMNGSTFVDSIVTDLQRRQMFRLSNVQGLMFAHTLGTAEETFVASRASARVMKLSSCWMPSATYKQDADGTNVAPVLETAFYRGFQHIHRKWVPSPGLQTWKNLYARYDLVDAASDAPTLQVAYVTDPFSSSYTNAGGALAASSRDVYARRPISKRVNGLGFKVAQTGPSADTIIYSLGSDFNARELSALS